MKNLKIFQFKEFLCATCSQYKLIKPSPTKVGIESLTFLECIQRDICGPFHVPCEPFRYFMVLVDVSNKWSHVCLLSTCNLEFTRLLTQIIRLRAQFPYYAIKSICINNTSEFSS